MSTDFHVFSTKRQFSRYVEWWATAKFAKDMRLDQAQDWAKRKEQWKAVAELAQELVGMLDTAPLGTDNDADDNGNGSDGNGSDGNGA
jgi:hypothetical protein